jgi:hypothetical protein
MVSNSATSIQEYLDQLSFDQREVISVLRDLIVKNLPAGYVETMNWGMICYEVPLAVYPNTYNKKPLMYAGLAAQKNHFSLYMSSVYQDAKEESMLRQGFELAGKKLDMGKSCIRFRKLDQLALDVIGQAIAATPLETFLAQYEASRDKGSRNSSSSI